MTINSIVRVSKHALPATKPSVLDYDSVTDGWDEREYRTDFGNDSVEGGYWSGAAGSVAFQSWPYSELCVILRGRVAVEDAEGERAEFGPGEPFLIPEGFAGTWHTLEPTEKVFVGVHRQG